MAAIFNLNHHASSVNFHIGKASSPFLTFDMSVSNVIVIVVMLVVFAVAILAPFPGRHVGGGSS